MLDSAYSSKPHVRRRQLLTATLLFWLSGCVSVRPEEKEHLAEPAMTWGDEGLSEQHEQHVLDNREGSTGGGDTRGGGCGCN